MRPLLFIPACFVYGCMFAQALKPEEITRIKEATVYVKVIHKLPLSDEEITSTGSGFFISKDGYVATNYHVIQNLISGYSIAYPTTVSGIKIIRNSGSARYKTYNAFVYAVDKDNDVAVLGVTDTLSTRFLTVDSSQKLSEASPVWVFGYPFGEKFSVLQRGPEITVTNGTITALRHNDKDRLKQIQLDAEVNHGNSGGPLVNAQGSVIGLVNMTGGESRVNFAVPSVYLAGLVKKYPLPANAAASDISISTVPPDASLFLDGVDIGSSPLKSFKVNAGWHTLCIEKEGYRTCLDQFTINASKDCSYALQEQKKIALIPDKEKRPAAPVPEEIQKAVTKIPEKNVLMKQDFSSQKDFEKWEQNTGGTNERTWFIEDGTLQNFEENGTLHAITLGDEAWKDYIVKVRMKIKGSEGDPRAGVIFRETTDGFYLFRVHRETNKAQLAYHCKGPFGWNVMMEKELPFDVTDAWYTASVYVSGNRIACFLDSIPVFSTVAEYSQRGKVGLYSVESKPLFDDLTVIKTDTWKEEQASSEEKGLVSFWFTDNFDMSSEWWYQYAGEKKYPAPWLFSDMGCSQCSDDSKTKFSDLTRYNLGDFEMNLSATFDKAKDNSTMQIYFRRINDEGLAIEISQKENKILLKQLNGKEEKVLKSVSIGPDFFSGYKTLKLIANGSRISFSSGYSASLEFEGRKLPASPGTFGIACSGLRLVLHQLSVTSVNK